MSALTTEFSKKTKRRFYAATFLSTLMSLGASLPDAPSSGAPFVPDYNPATAALSTPQARYFKSGVQKLQLRAAIECTPAFDALPQGLERRFQQSDILAALEFNTLAQKADYGSLDFLSKAAVFGHNGWRICADKVVMAFELSKLVGGELKNEGLPFVAYGAQKLIGLNVASVVDVPPQRLIADAFDVTLSLHRVPATATFDDLLVYATLQTLPILRVMKTDQLQHKQVRLDDTLTEVYAVADEISAISLPHLPQKKKSLKPRASSGAPLIDL